MRISDWSSDVGSSDLVKKIAIRSIAITDHADGPRSMSLSARWRALRARPPQSPGIHGGRGLRSRGRFRRDHHGREGYRRSRRRVPFGLWLSGGRSHGLLSPEHRERSEEHTSELQSLMRTSYAVFCLNKK